MVNHFKSTMKFTHGEIRVEGTIIFVLATIAENEKRDGWQSTTHSKELEEALAAAEEHRAARA